MNENSVELANSVGKLLTVLHGASHFRSNTDDQSRLFSTIISCVQFKKSPNITEW